MYKQRPLSGQEASFFLLGFMLAKKPVQAGINTVTLCPYWLSMCVCAFVLLCKCHLISTECVDCLFSFFVYEVHEVIPVFVHLLEDTLNCMNVIALDNKISTFTVCIFAQLQIHPLQVRGG